MKKLVLLCTALCLLFLGCDKEGVYNPSKKIRRISEQRQGEMKQLMQEWTWDNNLLSKIDYFENNQPSYTENLKYDSKNRIVKVEDYKYGDYYTITYKDNLISKVEYFWDNIMEESFFYTYENKKISKIVFTAYEVKKSVKRDSFISLLIPKEIGMRINDIKEKSMNKGGSLIITIKFSYEGNNVSNMEIMSEGEVYNYSYEQYDKKLNPFYNSFSPGGGMNLSKNNPGKEILRYHDDEFSLLITTEFDYTYDGNYPTEVVERYTIGSVNFRNTTFYEYK